MSNSKTNPRPLYNPIKAHFKPCWCAVCAICHVHCALSYPLHWFCLQKPGSVYYGAAIGCTGGVTSSRQFLLQWLLGIRALFGSPPPLHYDFHAFLYTLLVVSRVHTKEVTWYWSVSWGAFSLSYPWVIWVIPCDVFVSISLAWVYYGAVIALVVSRVHAKEVTWSVSWGAFSLLLVTWWFGLVRTLVTKVVFSCLELLLLRCHYTGTGRVTSSHMISQLRCIFIVALVTRRFGLVQTLVTRVVSGLVRTLVTSVIWWDTLVTKGGFWCDTSLHPHYDTHTTGDHFKNCLLYYYEMVIYRLSLVWFKTTSLVNSCWRS